MIKIEHTDVYGWEASVRGARNPMNSWEKSDSRMVYACEDGYCGYEMGENDNLLLQTLSDAGTDHGKFMRMVMVWCDITAPLYWWKEMDTYRVGVEKNSCSTMHKIHAKPFNLDDFSHDKLDGVSQDRVLMNTIKHLNEFREEYLRTKSKFFWWQLIQLLPSSYNQRRTCMISYAALRNMYHARRNHKLDEWREFCRWIETLPHCELIIGSEISV